MVLKKLVVSLLELIFQSKICNIRQTYNHISHLPGEEHQIDSMQSSHVASMLNLTIALSRDMYVKTNI